MTPTAPDQRQAPVQPGLTEPSSREMQDRYHKWVDVSCGIGRSDSGTRDGASRCVNKAACLHSLHNKQCFKKTYDVCLHH